MVEQSLFEVPFVCVTADREKIEIVGVFERLFRQVGLRRRQRALKICDRFAFAFVQLRFNVVREKRARPAIFDCLVSIPKTASIGFELVQQHDIVAPRQRGHWFGWRDGRFCRRL